MNRLLENRMMLRTTAMALLAAGLMPTVSAQTTDKAPEDSWQFSAGVGLVNRPKYAGSSDSKTQLLPLLSASYGRYFIGSVPGSGVPFGLGAYLYRGAQFRTGVALGGGFSKARKEPDDERLRGLGDIDNAARASIFSSYTLDWFTFRNSISADISGKNQGVLATLDFEGKYRMTDKLALSAGPGLTWGNGDYTQTFFGVDDGQSARSGLQRYTAKSGVNTLRFSLGAEYALTRQWGIAARATLARLHGDAAGSPITASKSQNTYGVFANYRF